MGFAGVAGLPGRTEAAIWLIAFVIFAVIIVRQASGKYFLHAFVVGEMNGIWLGVIHAAFVSTYLAKHHAITNSFRTLPSYGHRRIAMVILGPVIGAIFGIIAGLIAIAVGKVLKKKAPTIQP